MVVLSEGALHYLSLGSLERLVINCHLKGPGWLYIKNPSMLLNHCTVLLVLLP